MTEDTKLILNEIKGMRQDIAEVKEDVKDLKKSDLKKEKEICDIRMLIADFKLAYMERIEELSKTDNA